MSGWRQVKLQYIRTTFFFFLTVCDGSTNVSIRLKVVIIRGEKRSTLFKLLTTRNEVKRDELTLARELCIRCESGLDEF